MSAPVLVALGACLVMFGMSGLTWWFTRHERREMRGGK